MTVKQGDVFEHVRQNVKRRYIYCGKIEVEGETRYLLYLYNDFGATAQYKVVEREWMKDKRGEVEFIEEFPYSAVRLKKQFLDKYKPKCGRRGRRY